MSSKFNLLPIPAAFLALALATACGGAPPAQTETATAAQPAVEPVEDGVIASALGSWRGKKTLWTRYPANPQESDLDVTVEAGKLHYAWSYEGKPQTGAMVFSAEDTQRSATWTDTWHTKEEMTLSGSEDDGVIRVTGTYSTDGGPVWSWRTEIRLAAPDKLSINMFNILPDELYPEISERELPAVRMELQRVQPPL